jgi:hypothetical protein
VFDVHDATTLKSTPLFVLTLIWPAAAVVFYIIAMVWVIFDLDELNPASELKHRGLRTKLTLVSVCLGAATAIFAAGQVVFFLANEPLCKAASGKVNATFITAITNNAAIVIIFFMWNVSGETKHRLARNMQLTLVSSSSLKANGLTTFIKDTRQESDSHSFSFSVQTIDGVYERTVYYAYYLVAAARCRRGRLGGGWMCEVATHGSKYPNVD